MFVDFVKPYSLSNVYVYRASHSNSQDIDSVRDNKTHSNFRPRGAFTYRVETRINRDLTLLGRNGCRSRMTIRAFKRDNSASICTSTCSISTIANAVVEVNIPTDTGWIWATASKAAIFAQHVVEACLATLRQVGNGTWSSGGSHWC